MAKGKSTGKNHLPRASSPEGTEARVELRAKATPKNGQGFHFIIPGSRNRRKVGR